MSYLAWGQKLISQSAANFAAVIAVFYVSGFLSFLVYYRVLGIDNIEGSTQIYAEFAGRSLILIIQTFLISPIVLFNDKINFDWGGNALIIWTVITVSLIAFELVAKFYLRPRNIYLIEKNRIARFICLVCLVGITLPILSIETEIVSVRNVLQPFKINDFAEISKNVLRIQEEKLAENNLSNKDMLRSLDKFAEKIVARNTKIASVKDLFRTNVQERDLDGGDKERFHAFMTLILATAITISLLFTFNSLYKHRTIEIIVIVFIISQILFVPFLYGVLGKEYKYPVISFVYRDINNNVVKREGVILIEKNNDKLIIYDRLNFFRFDYIAEASIIDLQKVFTTSPFSNCSDERFKPCELYTLQ
ncbi:MAG: hypothetical protein WAX77_11055 [Methylococcaceae bacterium]